MTKKKETTATGHAIVFPDLAAFIASSKETTLLADAAADLRGLDEESADAWNQQINEDWEALAKQIVGGETL